MRAVSLFTPLLLLASCIQAKSFNYTTIPGLFLQDDNSTNATTFDYTAVNFGLINRTYISDSADSGNKTQWQRFTRYVSQLNHETPPGSSYKVLFMGRHGEGYHNAAESYYGTPAWNCYWSLLNGNSTTTWDDAHLTANGVQQALKANAFWQHEITIEKIHPPQSFYTSPLYRCLATANLTFSTGINVTHQGRFTPTIKELLREGISLHTCDRRSNKTFIHASFPTYKFERGFAEHDPLWNPVYAETPTGQDLRSQIVLDDIFSRDSATWISITSHSGEIASLLRVLGHRTFSLNTGAVIPVLVKAVVATVGNASQTATAAATRTTSLHCTDAPVTSVSNGGCVCMSSAAPVTTPLVTNIP